MYHRPEISFRCGPLALHRIKLAVHPHDQRASVIDATESTDRGFSLNQVAALSRTIGLDYQMAFRAHAEEFVAPAVVHLKVGHFAALIRREGDRYLLQDPTFKNDAWVTRTALKEEASGYFLIPADALLPGWRAVAVDEAETVWGKGNVPDPPAPPGPCDHSTEKCAPCPSKGMATPRVHLLNVSLNITDEPVGYAPPVGPAVRFTVRYNQRDIQFSSNFNYSNFGRKWTFDWLAFIIDSPANPMADVTYYMAGGGNRVYTGFDGATGAFAHQVLDQTKLIRTAPDSYELISPDGTRMVFDLADGGSALAGSSGTRRCFLTRLEDPTGNAVTLTYDATFRLDGITDAIGQVTTLAYEDVADPFKITKVSDPFGRSALFSYNPAGQLASITDVIGLVSEFAYEGAAGDFIATLTTPYGITTFTKTEDGTTRTLEMLYPDGEKERVEFNQNTNLGILGADPPQSVPIGMATRNEFLAFRNTYHWDRQACAHGYGDYTRARIYHWLHSADMQSPVGILESVKQPLEGRVWYAYAGQSSGNGPIVVGVSGNPTHIGRVLDDGSTQLYTYEYNAFGKVTKKIDPVGRTFSYSYAENGIDLLEVRQTRGGRNELLSQMSYNTQHRPLTATDAAGQTARFTYNTRGQVLTNTNAKNDTTVHVYDPAGRLMSVDGPLSGASTVFTFDSVGRVHTKTDESGYTLTFDHDDLDRVTKITFPDGTFDEFTYTRLDRTLIRDRAGRLTSFEHNSVRQMIRRTDPLNRATLFQWCKCGGLKRLTDPMGRSTTWRHDVQGRVKCKEYADGSKVTYLYENSLSRLSQRIDEQLQITQYDYNRDDTLSRITYTNAAVPTPPVAFAYDANYNRLRSMTDGTGTTRYAYHPIRTLASLGAGQLASVNGPRFDDAITFGYDELGRRISTAINGAASTVVYDPGGRVVTITNALGVFNNAYDGNSFRLASQVYPNGQSVEFAYAGNLQDQHLRRLTNRLGLTPISEFIYEHDIATRQIITWSQQIDEQTPGVFGLTYDAVDQQISATVSEAGAITNTFGYSYDFASNRLSDQADAATRDFSYNALNELTSIEGDGVLGTDVNYQWDHEQRLISIISGNETTEFTYDGLGRRVGIRFLLNGEEMSNRHFLWCGFEMCEERSPAGIVLKRYFGQGMTIESGLQAGAYFYSHDHLGSIRELTDGGGNVRARYSYDPFGRQTKQQGDLEADFAFTGMFCATEMVSLNLTTFRAYDLVAGRWLSRDPLDNSEVSQNANLYAYVNNNPVNLIDPLGLTGIDPDGPCCVNEAEAAKLALLYEVVGCGAAVASKTLFAAAACAVATLNFKNALRVLEECLKHCPDPAPPGPCEPIQFGPFSHPG
jgi:RHS repeat-associated protein